jgi:hypothetical protein
MAFGESSYCVLKNCHAVALRSLQGIDQYP